MISQKTIQNSAKNVKTYEDGLKLLQREEVRINSCQSFWKGEITVIGRVGKEELTLVLEKDNIKSGHCTCASASSMLCEHLVGLALAYERLTQKSPNSIVRTSQAMEKMLENYKNKSIDRMMADEKGGRVFLDAILHSNGSKPYLTFKVGSEKRSYIIKSLNAFYHAMKRQEDREYGKSLSFVHTKWAFQKESRELLDFLMRALEERAYYYHIYNPYRVLSIPGERDLLLTPQEIDEFFSLYQDREIRVEDGNEHDIKVLVLEKNPDLEIEIFDVAGSGCKLVLKDRPDVYFGLNRLYIYKDRTIFCCDEEYSAQMKVFFQSVKDSREALSVGKKDFALLCGQVLPILKKFMRVQTEIDFQPFSPQTLEAEFFFDSLDEKEGNHILAVTCEQKLKYGDFSFNPIIGTSVPVEIYRNYPEEYRIAKTLERYFHHCDSKEGVFLLKEEEDIYQLLVNGMEEFAKLGTIYVSESFRSMKVLPSPSVTVGISLSENILDLQIETGGMSREELMELLSHYHRKRKFYRLKNGKFIQMEDTALFAISELYEELSLKEKNEKEVIFYIPSYRAMYVEQILNESRGNLFRNKEFRKLIRDMKNIEDSDFEVPKHLRHILRGYQKIGYRWMKTLSCHGFGGILADDMGLGKTVQVITLLSDERVQLLENPALIVCPASVVYNWENEIQRFSPDLSVLTISGSAKERREIWEEDENAMIWITSYDSLKRDVDWYRKKEFSYQILDEAQVIKNHTTQTAKAVKAIRAKYRFALTGTPVENRLSELWSIFDYLMPGFLFSYSYFKEKFEAPIVREKEETAIKRLKQMIGPFVLRRLKKDVLQELPDKIETVIYANLDGEQKALYEANAKRVKEELVSQSEEEFRSRKFEILAELTRLRQICCDPGLCYENYEENSAKLSICLELMEEGIAGGHKILVFSQFTTMLKRIRKELETRGIESYWITGQTEKKERIDLVNHFNQNEVSVFLISLKAGGTGINLTGADMVIHYDPWWNIAAQNQATDRAHRIGQKNTVNVFQLIAKNTIEENILNIQEKKRKLAEQVIGGEDMGFGALNREAFLELFQHNM